MNYHGQVIEAILTTLERDGPMTYVSIAQITGMPKNSVRKACCKLAAETSDQRRVYVKDWTRMQDGEREYLRQVYAFGKGQNKKRPATKHRNEVVRDYLGRVQASLGCNAFGPLYSKRKAVRIMAERRQANPNHKGD